METCFKNLGFLFRACYASLLDCAVLAYYRALSFLFSGPCDARCSGLTAGADLLFKAFRPGQNFNLLLGAHESRLFLVLAVVRATEDRLGRLCCSHGLLLKCSIVSLIKAGSRDLKLRGVPLLKGRDELLLDCVDLALAVCVLVFCVL